MSGRLRFAVVALVLLVGGCATGRTGSAGPRFSSPPAPTSSVASRPAGPTGSWRWLPAARPPSGTYGGVWTGREMLRYAPNTSDPNGSGTPMGSVAAAYDPATERWTSLPPSVLRGRTGVNAAW